MTASRFWCQMVGQAFHSYPLSGSTDRPEPYVRSPACLICSAVIRPRNREISCAYPWTNGSLESVAHISADTSQYGKIGEPKRCPSQWVS